MHGKNQTLSERPTCAEAKFQPPHNPPVLQEIDRPGVLAMAHGLWKTIPTVSGIQCTPQKPCFRVNRTPSQLCELPSGGCEQGPQHCSSFLEAVFGNWGVGEASFSEAAGHFIGRPSCSSDFFVSSACGTAPLWQLALPSRS